MKETIEQLFEEYMKERQYSRRLSEVSLNGYRYAFNLFMKIMPGTELVDLSDKTMIEFFTRLEKRKRTVGRGEIKEGIKKSTVATYRSKLNSFFNWLKIKGKIQDNPFTFMEYPDVQYEDMKYLKKEEVEKIMIAMEMRIDWKNLFVKKRNAAIIRVLLCCGIRRRELLGLKISDIDFGRREMTVRAETSKSRITRTIPLNSSVMAALEDYCNELKKKNYSSPYFFVSENGDKQLTDHGFKHLIDDLNRRTGVKFHAHQFRHTFAVNVLLNNGNEIAKLKQLMGHRDIRMTAAYLRCLPTRALRQDVEMLNLENLY